MEKNAKQKIFSSALKIIFFLLNVYAHTCESFVVRRKYAAFKNFSDIFYARLEFFYSF